MKEIGGYIELDNYRLPMMHQEAIALNCARNALKYLIELKEIKKILIPKFLCSTVAEACRDMGVYIEYYHVNIRFEPLIEETDGNSWLYLVNYYGQLTNDFIEELNCQYHGKLILDNTQAFYEKPIPGIHTIYTCRKFFGVPDGAFLYTDDRLKRALPQDLSFDNMHYLLGRYERTASDFYDEYINEEERFRHSDVCLMSKLTSNLLRAIDYDYVKERRNINYIHLHEKLGAINYLQLRIPKGAFMYPFYIKGAADIRKKLRDQKIYIPTLWPDVYKLCKENEIEYQLADNILPLPVDQRYDINDMDNMIAEINKMLS